jgi:polysaccharide biosynthesis transport protein
MTIPLPLDRGAVAQRGVSLPETDEIDLIEVIRTLWRGKIWIGLAMLLAGMIGFGYAKYIAVPRYTAKAVVALENRQETVVDLDSVMSGLSGDQASINTELEVLRSRKLILQVVDAMGLTSDPEFNPLIAPDGQLHPTSEHVRNATADEVLRAISVANVRSSYVYTITANTTSAEKSMTLANTLAELYIRDQLTVKFEATAQATAWLTERVDSLKAELATAEVGVQAFTANTDLVSPEAFDALNRQIKDGRDRLASLIQTRDALATQHAMLVAANESGDPAQMLAASDDSTIASLAAEGRTNDAFALRFAALLDKSATDLARASAQVTSLSASMMQLSESYDRQSRDLVTLEQLEREAQATRTIYEYFLTRLKETSVQEGIQQPDSRVLSYAALPTIPSEPRKRMVLALSLLAGLVVGAAALLLREMQHSGFRTAEQLEQATGITVMGQLPRIPARTRKSVIEYLIDKPTSAAAEAVRNLRTSVVLSNIDRPPQVILCSSSLSGEGKTTTAIALAQNFAGLGKSVLLIEGDIRRPVFSEYFNLADPRGLLAALAGDARFEEVVQPLETIGADILPGGNSHINAADIYSSDQFAVFMRDMRSRYDIVIIDTPPVLLVPDARIIAQIADAILFTVRWDKTSRAQVREAVRQFEIAGHSISGLVLGQIDPKGMKRYGYGGRYGAYATGTNAYYNT